MHDSQGKWSTLNGAIATLWVAFMVVVFSLPITYPSTPATTNWAGVMLLGVLILSLVYYFFPYIGAYKWFLGPVRETPVDEASDAFAADPKHFCRGDDPSEKASMRAESVNEGVSPEDSRAVHPEK